MTSALAVALWQSRQIESGSLIPARVAAAKVSGHAIVGVRGAEGRAVAVGARVLVVERANGRRHRGGRRV